MVYLIFSRCEFLTEEDILPPRTFYKSNLFLSCLLLPSDLVINFQRSYDVMVSIMDFESIYLGSNPSMTFITGFDVSLAEWLRRQT